MSARLRARTRRLDRDLDLVDVACGDGVLFTRRGVGLAGRGVAARLAGVARSSLAAQVHELLASIELDDEVGRPGCGPVAFAALPFDPDEAATVLVPATVVGRGDDGSRWVTTVGSDPAAIEGSAGGPSTPTPEPSRFTVRAPVPAEAWCELVKRGRDAILAGRLEKVVLAREVLVESDRSFEVTGVLSRLRAGFPLAHTFSVDGFIGASPELLVSRHGDMVRSHPMAGSAPRSADPAADARLAAGLLASAKDRHEHQVTIDRVHETILPWCSYLDAEAEPSVVQLTNAQHLATLVEGRLSDPAPSVLELVHALHPTPAVGGEPRSEALQLIAELEPEGRGRYAGPVGWVDAAGNGEWAVGIRSASVSGSTARLFAGVGVVADSDPDAELAETRFKLQAMLAALVRP